MTSRTTLLAVLVLAIHAGSGFAQTQPQTPLHGPVQPYAQQATRPAAAQPAAPAGAAAVVPQNVPTLQRRAPASIRQTFQLTPADQGVVNDVLNRWEELSKDHKRLSIKFNRFEFNATFAESPNKPIHIDHGEARFEAPDKWLWEIKGEYVDGKLVEGQRAERFVCDGKSIHEFNYNDKTVTQHMLANDTSGTDLIKSVLPFLFGPKADDLNRRYAIRLIAFPGLPKDHICIDAWPRFQQEARNYNNAQLILRWSDMQPTGMRLVLPTETDKISYEFTEVKINDNNPLNLLNDPFKVKAPSGWTLHVEQMPSAQVGARPAATTTVK